MPSQTSGPTSSHGDQGPEFGKAMLIAAMQTDTDSQGRDGWRTV